ncbi:MAG: flagellum-specific ATP synthase FliI, partial [Armatimonadota bacterium]
MQIPTPTIGKLRKAIDRTQSFVQYGKVKQVIGLVIESTGPSSKIGDICYVESGEKRVPVEVVGFQGSNILLMPLGE